MKKVYKLRALSEIQKTVFVVCFNKAHITINGI